MRAETAATAFVTRRRQRRRGRRLLLLAGDQSVSRCRSVSDNVTCALTRSEGGQVGVSFARARVGQARWTGACPSGTRRGRGHKQVVRLADLFPSFPFSSRFVVNPSIPPTTRNPPSWSRCTSSHFSVCGFFSPSASWLGFALG